MSRKVFFLIASLVVLSFLVAACGGTGGGESGVPREFPVPGSQWRLRLDVDSSDVSVGR